MRLSIAGHGSDDHGSGPRCLSPKSLWIASLFAVLLLAACASPRNPGVVWHDWSTWPSYQQGYEPTGRPAVKR